MQRRHEVFCSIDRLFVWFEYVATILLPQVAESSWVDKMFLMHHAYDESRQKID